MRVVFFGTPELAVPTLEAVAATHEVAAVVCQPDRPKGRGKKMIPPATKVWAEEHDFPVHQPTKLNDGTFEAWLKDIGAKVGVLVAYGRLLKEPILDAFPHGILNIHPSLLPLYRGPSPIQSAVLNGDAETGVSIMRLEMEMDAGPILLQERVPIGTDNSAVTMSDRLAKLGAEMMVQGLALVASGNAQWTAQDDSAATYCHLIRKTDGAIDWSKSAAALHNLVRGALPWPVAHFGWNNEVYRIHRSESVDEPTNAEPGTVTKVGKNTLHVATGDGQLAVLDIQAPGKRAMAVGDFLRGHNIEPGTVFDSVKTEGTC